MSLSPGARLAGYEIQSLLGAGGMGEVYKATDTRLNRTVAIKVLPAHVASDPVLKQRFEREAQTLAALHDPHICSVFDVGHQAGVDYVVMEFVEGQTLADRLRDKGPMPAPQAIGCAIQIAEALDKAHRAGIVHRDLKPANVMVMRSGSTPHGAPQIKLLDFGLAKRQAPGGGDQTQAQTTSAPLTETGSILGTFQYMAPEQVEGQEADARSDIFAFGATLYEMLTGKRAFDGKSQASVIAAILERQPPAVSTIQPTSPRALDRILTGCLAKDPDDRWQSARDVGRQLRAIADEQSATAEMPASRPRRTSRAIRLGFASAAAGMLVGAALTAILVGRFSRPAAAPLLPQRVSIVPPADHPLIFTGAVPQSSLVMSADGRRLAYASNDGWVVRSLDALTVTPLGVFANAAFFSPDGQWLAFLTAGKLQKISVSGGRPVTIADQVRNSSPFGDWGEGATIVFPMAGRINKVSADGGTPVAITTVDAGKGEEHNYPSFVTGAGAVLFTARFDEQPPRIDVLRLDTGERHTVIENARTARYIASGHILFQRDDAVFVVPFDIRTLKVSGQAIPLEQNIRREGQFSAGDYAQLAASATGMLAYVPGEGAANQLGWVDASGNYTPLDLPPGRYDLPRVSPDGTQIAYEVYVSGGAVWTANNTVRVFDISHGATSQLRNAGPLRAPIWHPDGRALTVFSRRSGAPGIYLVQPDGSERLIVPASDGAELRPGSWSPDGRTLAYTSQGAGGEHVWIVPFDEPGSARRLLPSLPHEYGPEFSGDGRWITYTSDVSGRQEVYAMRFPSGAPVRMTFGGAVAGVWHPRANRLFVQTIGQRPAIQEVPLTIREAEIQAGSPRILFEMRAVSATGQMEAYRTSNNFGPRFDVAPDGRILAARGADSRNLREIVLVQNWFEELKKIAPVN